jgi:hypothetical protein
MHDGTGCTLGLIVDDGDQLGRSNWIMHTSNAVASGARVSSTNTEFRYYVQSSSGAYMQMNIAKAAAAPGKSFVLVTFKAGDLRITSGTTWIWGTSAVAGTLPTGNQLLPLVLGGQGSTTWYQGAIGQAVLVGKFMNYFELFRFSKWFRTKFNLAWSA